MIRPLCWLLYVLPFFCGGFYSETCAAVSVFLLGYLFYLCKNQKSFLLCLSDSLLAIVVLVLGYSLSFLWAADKGMAAWGVVHFLPVLLFALVLTQFAKEQRLQIYGLIPISGVVMTILSLVMQYIPDVSQLVTVEGRLAGFWEYPNTYAAFLLIALMISLTEPNRRRWFCWTEMVMIYGILASGSRTAFLILLVLLVVVCLYYRSKRLTLEVLTALAGAITVSLLLSALDMGGESDRYLTTVSDSSTLLCRLLYFSDALKVIARNPLGLGYLGYAAAQGSFQTGVYHVTFVHNELLQILLDVGWVPAFILTMVIVLSFFHKETGIREKLILLALLGHSMMDFNLQYLAMWLYLLPTLRFSQVQTMTVRKGGRFWVALASVGVCLCLWLSTGDWLYRIGQVELCLNITPFHTNALEYRMTQITDPVVLEDTADAVLELDPYSSIAYSAKANVAHAYRDSNGVIENKQKAIACSRYSLGEYCDYFDKLMELYTYFKERGDTENAEAARQLLLRIPEALSELEDSTSSLAWKLEHKPELVLPQDYQQQLAELAS